VNESLAVYFSVEKKGSNISIIYNIRFLNQHNASI
jgi:hypothetical protein